MSTPTIAQVESWKPLTLVSAGEAVRAAGADLVDRLAEVDLAVDTTARKWQGDAGAAASMRAVSEGVTATVSKRATDSVGASMVAQGETIDAYRTAILNTRDAAVDVHGMSVAPDGTVTSPTVPGAYDDALRPVLQGRLDRQAADFQTSLKESLAQCGSALAELEAAVSVGLDDLERHGGPGGAETAAIVLSGEDGRDLGSQVRAAIDIGNPIPSDVLAGLTEDLRATGLSAEQLRDYLNGATATIPAGTQQYLKEFYDNAGVDGFAAASQQLQSQGPAGQQAAASLANGVMVLSNERVGTGRDADGNLTGTGGYENLPQDMRDLVSTRPSRGIEGLDSNSLTYPGDGPMTEDHKSVVEGQTKLFDALALAEAGHDPGTKMSTELIRQGMHTAALDAHGGALPFGNQPLDTAGHTETLEKAIELGSRNIDGAHAILTGQGASDVLGSGYNADAALMPLLQRDDGTAVASLTDWIPRDAHTIAPEGTPDFRASERAGQAARGLAEVMAATESSNGTNNYTTLLSGDAKIGGGTAVQVAEALSPFVGDMTGMTRDLTQTNGFGEVGGSRDYIGGPVEPLRIFSILDSDDQASQIINGTALAESQRMDRVFATTGYSELGDQAYRLQWLVDHGLSTEMDQRVADGVDEQDAANSRNSKFTAAWTAGQIVAGGFGPGGIAVAAGSEFLKPYVLTVDDLATPQPREITFDSSQLGFDRGSDPYVASEWGSADFRRHNVLDALVSNGSIDINDVPDVYKNADGTTVLPYSEAVRNVVDMDADRVRYEIYEITTRLIENAGITNLEDYAGAATGDEQRDRLAAAIRPEGNSPTRQDILDWLSSDQSSRDSKNTWPLDIHR
ncbi:TPR repeat region-containing protein [Rhodococcoides fascians]|uniref:TPR repeat region-containing protein n=1 Tax=Rhodococcoides fascians TaxID=1828 RepID=UPI0005672622|nr:MULTISPECIES: hypothetical protein [Rhodococcus]OZE96544.1 hypothetical protein CH301_18900 [Rhodococcus sp. 15-1189-1-1a]OZF11591.1 hypothetical protein CH299_19430 [Rhodococcus sp. 14-2686-1-2]